MQRINFILLLILALSFAKGHSTLAQTFRASELTQGYARQALFDIPVGDKSQNIDVWWQPTESKEGGAATGLRVRGGRVYIGDGGNGAVKVFDLNGRYLTRTHGDFSALLARDARVTRAGTSDDILALRTIAVNRQGDIFTLSGLSYENITKFSPAGKMLWSVSIGDVFPNSNERGGTFIFPAPNGGVGVSITRYSPPFPSQHLAWLDKNGKLVKTVEADFSDENGFYQFDKAKVQPAFTGTLRALDKEDKFRFERQIQITPQIKALFSPHMKGSTVGLDYPYVSPSGTFYSVNQVVLLTRFNIYPNNERQSYNTGMHTIIIPYDSLGKPMGWLRIPSAPFGDFDPIITMDEHNNIYTLEYIPNKVRVVRYKWLGSSKR